MGSKRRRVKLQITESLQEEAAGIYFGSDSRVSGGITADCGLCGRRSKLILGHVVPKWTHKWMKAEGGVLGHYRSLGIRTREQDGSKHYMLCGHCEQKLGVAEAYVARLTEWVDEEMERNPYYEEGTFLLSPLDLGKVEQYLCAIALRAHIAPSPPFHQISFSERERLVILDVLNGKAGWPRVRVHAIRFFEHIFPGINPKGMLFMQQLPDQYVPGFCIMLAGWEWSVLFDLDGSYEKLQFPTSDLRPGEEAEIACGDITLHRNVSPWLYEKKSEPTE